MTTLAEYIIVVGAENLPPMLKKSMYDSWASRIRLFIKRKKHGRMMLDSIDNGPLVYDVLSLYGLVVGSIRRIQVLDTTYWGFLGVGTTLDIFQNIILIPYLEYGVLILFGYGVLIFIPLWSLVSADTDMPYLP
ncbi:hypothetical protein Tco_0200376 [Tanacetum coccineum]